MRSGLEYTRGGSTVTHFVLSLNSSKLPECGFWNNTYSLWPRTMSSGGGRGFLLTQYNTLSYNSRVNRLLSIAEHHNKLLGKAGG